MITQRRMRRAVPVLFLFTLSGCGGGATPDSSTTVVLSTPTSPSRATVPTVSSGQVSRALVAAPYQYRTIAGATLTLYPYMGRNVALLTARNDLDEAVLGQILAAIDAAYDYLVAATGRRPTPYFTYQGLGTIAVVAATCGAGCGYLGFSGIEIMPQNFQRLYDGVARANEFDPLLFWELGRNFWFYTDAIEYKGTGGGVVTTGFAQFIQLISMEATGLKCGPVGASATIPCATQRARIEELVTLYQADPSLNWNNTLRVGRGPTNPYGLDGIGLLASFLFKLTALFGASPSEFPARVWREVGKRPAARTSEEAVDNLVLAASAAVGANLTTLFADQWRWPVSEGARAEATRRFGAPH